MFQSHPLLVVEDRIWNVQFRYGTQLNTPPRINQYLGDSTPTGGAVLSTAFISERCNSNHWHLLDISGEANVNTVSLIKILLKHPSSLHFNELLFMAFQCQQSANRLCLCWLCVSVHHFSSYDSDSQSAWSCLLTESKVSFNQMFSCRCSHSQLLTSCFPIGDAIYSDTINKSQH